MLHHRNLFCITGRPIARCFRGYMTSKNWPFSLKIIKMHYGPCVKSFLNLAMGPLTCLARCSPSAFEQCPFHWWWGVFWRSTKWVSRTDDKKWPDWLPCFHQVSAVERVKCFTIVWSLVESIEHSSTNRWWNLSILFKMMQVAMGAELVHFLKTPTHIVDLEN